PQHSTTTLFPYTTLFRSIKTGLNTVLYMARLRAIEEDFHIKPVVLENIVHDVNRENKRFFMRKEVYPKLEQERPENTVETDEKGLSSMTAHLVQDAVKSPAGVSTPIMRSLHERGE